MRVFSLCKYNKPRTQCPGLGGLEPIGQADCDARGLHDRRHMATRLNGHTAQVDGLSGGGRRTLHQNSDGEYTLIDAAVQHMRRLNDDLITLASATTGITQIDTFDGANSSCRHFVGRHNMPFQVRTTTHGIINIIIP